MEVCGVTRDDLQIVGDEIRASGYVVASFRDDCPATVREEFECLLMENVHLERRAGFTYANRAPD